MLPARLTTHVSLQFQHQLGGPRTVNLAAQPRPNWPRNRRQPAELSLSPSRGRRRTGQPQPRRDVNAGPRRSGGLLKVIIIIERGLQDGGAGRRVVDRLVPRRHTQDTQPKAAAERRAYRPRDQATAWLPRGGHRGEAAVGRQARPHTQALQQGTVVLQGDTNEFLFCWHFLFSVVLGKDALSVRNLFWDFFF